MTSLLEMTNTIGISKNIEENKLEIGTILKSGTVPTNMMMRKMPQSSEDNPTPAQAEVKVEDNLEEENRCRKLNIKPVPTSPNNKRDY